MGFLIFLTFILTFFPELPFNFPKHEQLPDSPTEMIFPPYIAQPCSLPCCRPITSSSVPRTANFRRNSFSLVPGGRSPTPPRPPPVVYERTYISIPETSHSEVLLQPQRIPAYKMVPLIKPASSMPGGLAAVQQISSHDTDVDLRNDYNGNNGRSTPHRGSQPNLCTNSLHNEERVKRLRSSGLDDMTTPSNTNVHKKDASLSISNLTANSTPNQPPYFSNYGRYGGSRAASIEPRSTPYYYHELMQKRNNSIFDSKLNLLNEEKYDDNNPPSLGAISTHSEPLAATNRRNYRSATQSVLNGSSKLANANTPTYEGNNGYASSSELFHNTGTSTFDDEKNLKSLGPIPATRNLYPFYATNKSNQPPARPALPQNIMQINHNSKNNNNNVDSNNNVGLRNECLT